MSGPAAGPAGLEGLSEQEAARRLAARPRSSERGTSRSYVSIVRANVLTVFNAILAGFGAVTLIFGDWRDALFLGVIVANSGIGITQEVRAKRTLDRLALLVAPRGEVLRDGAVRKVPVEEVVPGDLVLLSPGEQVVADGRVLVANELRLDESILSGESEPARRAAGEEVRSGAFVVEGTGVCEVTAVGAESFAERLTGQARSFRHPRSPLERAINRLLYALVVLVILLGALLGYSLYHRHVPVHTAVATSGGGRREPDPGGSRGARQPHLRGRCRADVAAGDPRAAAQRDRVARVRGHDLHGQDRDAHTRQHCASSKSCLRPPSPRSVCASRSAQLAASASARNLTLRGDRGRHSRRAHDPARRGHVLEPATLERGRTPRGRPVPRRARAHAARGARRERAGAPARRATRTRGRPRPGASAAEAGELPPPDLEPLGLVVLAEELRPGVEETIAFLRREGVEVKVLSGDAPQTVAAIARDVGIPLAGVSDGDAIPDDPIELRRFAVDATVVGRISPEGKQAIVRALTEEGRYVAMVGDGVNDVPALKSSRLAIAQGAGTQMARSVADLVLVTGDFDAVPIARGRRPPGAAQPPAGHASSTSRSPRSQPS